MSYGTIEMGLFIEHFIVNISFFFEQVNYYRRTKNGTHEREREKGGIVFEW